MVGIQTVVQEIRRKAEAEQGFDGISVFFRKFLILMIG